MAGIVGPTGDLDRAPGSRRAAGQPGRVVRPVGALRRNEMTVARDSLVAARDAVADGQPQQARTFVTAASDAASRASDHVNGPMWNVAAAIPGLGDTPRTAQAVATSLDDTLAALQPLTEQLNVLDPSTLIQEGQIDIGALETALPAMQKARPGVDAAVATVESAPLGGMVLPRVRTAAEDYTEELTTPSEHPVHRGDVRRDRRAHAGRG